MGQGKWVSSALPSQYVIDRCDYSRYLHIASLQSTARLLHASHWVEVHNAKGSDQDQHVETTYAIELLAYAHTLIEKRKRS